MAQVMRFDVARWAADDSRVPDRLSTIERISSADVVRTRDFHLSLGSRLSDSDQHGSHGSSEHGSSLQMWSINGKPYRPGVDIAQPQLGTVERWRFTTDVHHPVHAHLVHFQVEQDGAPAWKDTIDVAPSSRAEVLVPIEGYRGRYVLHCHNLEHEDRMMMADFSVV
ncbi:multicopper oxidase domain-containing protein [Janibacter hoylei]|uniref:multicopper oxidase family protein n=1 Tax=Janibacter hoylei TaxID=364298 RepID=UPI002237F864|nr:multicopper oxidase domain-containing protein [Janibacter hoylei]MCW4601725.1 multicopper oxidase domain-containing protein [Janibacter hoylei]